MSALHRLTEKLKIIDEAYGAVDKELHGSIRPANIAVLRLLNEELKRKLHTSGKNRVSIDIIKEAVQEFIDNLRLSSARSVRYVSYGLTTLSINSNQIIINDELRFKTLISEATGLGQWRTKNPLVFRRCYQGLMDCYFEYDPASPESTAAGQRNWVQLRKYLQTNSQYLAIEGKYNPDWIGVVTENLQLFKGNPCADFVEEALDHNTTRLDQVLSELNITQSSWFHRELIFSQIRKASEKTQDKFISYIPQFLALLDKNAVYRNQGLALILDHYAELKNPTAHIVLKEQSIRYWGTPWLPSNKPNWGLVTEETKQMVSTWLKTEFIAAFFEKLAKDGVGDGRRAKFWQRYINSMDHVHFALSSTVRYSKDADLKLLIKKMQGLHTELSGTGSSNNAFIMYFGNFVIIEFGDAGHALYGYDRRSGEPFDKDKTFFTAVDHANSLKRSSKILWLSHNDNNHGYDQWEDRFEDELESKLNLVIDVRDDGVRSRITTIPEPSTSFTAAPEPDKTQDGFMTDLEHFANSHRLILEDKTSKGGNLWIRTDDSNYEINIALQSRGFRFKPEKGWWK